MISSALFRKPLAFSLLVALALVIGMAVTPLAADTFEKETEKEKEAVKLVRDVRRGGYDVISAEELKALIASEPNLLMIDTMPYAESYKKEHVPGAKQFLFPIPDMSSWDAQQTGGKSLEDFTALLGAEKNRKIVMYCGFVKCTRSHNAAAWAVKQGYTQVLRFAGGIYAWKGAGYTVESLP